MSFRSHLVITSDRPANRDCSLGIVAKFLNKQKVSNEDDILGKSTNVARKPAISAGQLVSCLGNLEIQ
jgi:hypothetical protein